MAALSRQARNKGLSRFKGMKCYEKSMRGSDVTSYKRMKDENENRSSEHRSDEEKI